MALCTGFLNNKESDSCLSWYTSSSLPNMKAIHCQNNGNIQLWKTVNQTVNLEQHLMPEARTPARPDIAFLKDRLF